jgi:hypothetical protein
MLKIKPISNYFTSSYIVTRRARYATNVALDFTFGSRRPRWGVVTFRVARRSARRHDSHSKSITTGQAWCHPVTLTCDAYATDSMRARYLSVIMAWRVRYRRGRCDADAWCRGPGFGDGTCHSPVRAYRRYIRGHLTARRTARNRVRETRTL